MLLSLIVLALALAVPLISPARWTSGILLVVFAACHAALLVEHRRGAPYDGFRVPRCVPAVGLVLTVAFLVLQAVVRPEA